MKICELINELHKYDTELEITISDGQDFHFYHTKKLEFEQHISDGILDIGIGGCDITEEDKEEDE